MPRKRGPGRPKLPRGKKRSVTLPAAKLTPAEMRVVHDKARRLGLDLSALIRHCVLG